MTGLADDPRKEAEEFKLVTFGRGGRFTAADIDRISRLLEQEDLARFSREKG